MATTKPNPGIHDPCDAILGYLNFSSGARDPQFFRALNDVYRWTTTALATPTHTLPGSAERDDPRLNNTVQEVLNSRLLVLSRTKEAFAECRQARSVLDAFERLVPAYFEFHRDLLFHQAIDDIFGPFFTGIVFESLLRQQPPWDDVIGPVEGAIRQVNDFVGYRPIPVLESLRVEPRLHERVRPVPLYLAQCETACGRYEPIVRGALTILGQTDSDLCAAMGFDLSRLEELSFDPRAYDFDHPVNRRLNYHFGEWDPHCLDQQGYYCRFVIREVTLQALMSRVGHADRLKLPQDELLWEASLVLAGTMLMASSISGDHPAAHDSTMTIGKLIQTIARCRDDFYARWLESMTADSGERLRREAERLHQPFGAMRHHLNSYLALQRARQLERVRLAKVFARMGYMNAAQRQADAVQVASARIICRIDCRLTACDHALRQEEQEGVLDQLDHIIDLIHRGIECGAIVDPWNILGFEANFSLFPAPENSVYDHRVDDLLRLIDRTFDVMARLWSSAAAKSDDATCRGVQARYEEFANWWHQFAAHEVSIVEAERPLDGLQAARNVSRALGEWQRGGAATGDLGFWAPHVDGFVTAKPYALVVETLLDHNDLVASMSLLVHWLSQAGKVAFEARGASYHDLAARWVQQVGDGLLESVSPDHAASPDRESSVHRNGHLLCKFFDYVEANADEFWEVPRFQLGDDTVPGRRPRNHEPNSGEIPGQDNRDGGLFDAAYEDVVYRDSTDDGMEGAIFENRRTDEDDWDAELERCQQRLLFLYTLAGLWRSSAVALGRIAESQFLDKDRPALEAALASWHDRAVANRHQLLRFMDEIAAARLTRAGTDVDAMARYNRQRMQKESILEQAILTCVRTASAELALRAARLVVAQEGQADGSLVPLEAEPHDSIDQEMEFAARLVASALRQDRAATEQLSNQLIEILPEREVLYAPLARGGEPRRIAEVRMRHQYLQDTLVALPRLGLIRNTLRLIETIRGMERNVPQGRGVVTQFDDMFEAGFQELVELLVRSTDNGRQLLQSDDEDADTVLISCLEQLAESALAIWLRHSQSLRLSVLERVRSPSQWKRLVAFIGKYGDEIFTQDFLHPGNIRAILHYGTEQWLSDLIADDLQRPNIKLLDELDQEISREEAALWLSIILEAVSEGYTEYDDYNSTTTQSDSGSKLYILLDFLRLRSEYDRVAWNLRPVILAHRVLVRRHRSEAAQLWRRLLHERLGAEANSYAQKLARLQKKHAITLGTICQRIDERFLQPMTIDRMQSLIEPAIAQSQSGAPCHAFEILAEEAEILMRDSQGSGRNVPKWLAALEEEMDRLDRTSPPEIFQDTDYAIDLRQGVLSLDELQAELGPDEED